MDATRDTHNNDAYPTFTSDHLQNHQTEFHGYFHSSDNENVLKSMQEAQLRAWGIRVVQLMNLFDIHGVADGKQLWYPWKGSKLEASIDMPINRYVRDVQPSITYIKQHAILKPEHLPSIQQLNILAPHNPNDEYATNLQLCPTMHIKLHDELSKSLDTALLIEEPNVLTQISLPNRIMVQGEFKDPICIKRQNKHRKIKTSRDISIDLFSTNNAYSKSFLINEGDVIRQFNWDCTQRKKALDGLIDNLSLTDMLHGYCVGVPVKEKNCRQMSSTTAMVRLAKGNGSDIFLFGITLEIFFTDEQLVSFSTNIPDSMNERECAICLEVLRGNLWRCKCCKNELHTVCWETYSKTIKEGICPYCRN